MRDTGRAFLHNRRREIRSRMKMFASNRGAVYLGIAGGLLVASGGMFGAYLVTTSKDKSAHAATSPARSEKPGATLDLEPALTAEVEVVAAAQKTRLRWSELGAVPDEAELRRAKGSVAELAKTGTIPLR